MNVWIDLETYCETPITYGTHAYAEKAEIMLFAYAVDDGPVTVWDRTKTKEIPSALADAIEQADTITAHNSGFDRTILRHVLPELCPPVEKWRDTMVQALTHSLPGALGELCDILGVESDDAKDKEGRALLMLFCKPRPKAFKGPARATRETHPQEWAQFVAYAHNDITAMRAIQQKMPTWNYRGEELALWHLDQVINDRGVAVDLELADCATEAVARAQRTLAKRTQQLTGGAVETATQRDALLAHLLKEHGVELPDLQKSTLERRINDPDLPPALRELLGIRLQASTTSTSKYRALQRGASSDGRLRGTLQFCGASRTGRWAGRLFQPQNLPRPTLRQPVIDLGIEALKAGAAELITDNIMELTSSAIRGCLVAAPGKKLVVSDLSNIEGRGLVHLAGEQWKLQAFRDYDQGKGHDLYKMAYAKSFSTDPASVNDDQRQIGKVQELALGYEGGVGAFLTFAAVYGIDLEELGEQAIDVLPTDIVAEARSMLEWLQRSKRPTFGLSDRAWIVCDSFKRSWRYAHPAVATLWKDLAEAVRKAIQAPGRMLDVRGLKIRRDGNWLRIRLPSGRYLCYPSPHVEHDTGQISYMGINQYSRKWSRLLTYGGKLVENVTQAYARDIMAHNMPHIERAGYRIVLTVHDEVITECPDSDEFNPEGLSELLAQTPPWADDIPLAAAGFQAYRYRKD